MTREIRAETEEEVLRQAAEHAHTVHGIQVTPEVAVQVESHIQDLSDSDLEQVVGGSGVNAATATSLEFDDATK